MSAELSRMLASTGGTRSLLILLPFIAVCLTLVATALHHRRLRARHGDARGMWLYFISFFCFFVAAPVLIIVLSEPAPLHTLASLGIQAGKWTRGCIMVGIAIPVTLLMSHLSSNMPEMQAQYPFSKAACASDGSFVGYEIGYLSLYYTAWEFLYRGILFFPLLNAFGFVPAVAITTAISTLHHLGHPDSEIWAAFAGGLIFGLIAFLTDSVFYGIAIHGMLGVFDDAFIYVRFHRGRPRAAQ
jgi:membrane protease YdiL (CAAX protease family)